MRESPALTTVIAASFRRTLIEQATELIPSTLHAMSLAVGLPSQLFFARLVDASPNALLGAYQGHFAVYLLLGVALLDVQNQIVSSLARTLREAQVSGSLESMLATPTPTNMLLFALMLPGAAAAMLRVGLYVVVGHAFLGLSFRTVNPWGALAVGVAAIATFMGFALVGAALTMTLRRADPVSYLVAALSVVAGGVFYPSAVLPAWLAIGGSFIPIAPALEGLRAAALQNAGPMALRGSLGRLAIVFMVVGPFGAWFFRKMLSRARVTGSLTAW